MTKGVKKIYENDNPVEPKNETNTTYNNKGTNGYSRFKNPKHPLFGENENISISGFSIFAITELIKNP